MMVITPSLLACRRGHSKKKDACICSKGVNGDNFREQVAQEESDTSEDVPGINTNCRCFLYIVPCQSPYILVSIVYELKQ